MRVPGHQRKSYTWRWTAALAGLAVLAFALVMAVTVRPAERVQAANFTVNLLTDAADLGDANGNGAFDALETDGGGTAGCDTDAVTAGSQCTLRAAIYEANRNGDTADNITFGSLLGTIGIATTLPVGASPGLGAGPLALADHTTIDGNGNVTVSGGAFSCFTVTSASNVIRDLGITGCLLVTQGGVLITGEDADSNAVRGNTLVGNTNGVVIAAGADSNTIGGTTAADRNVIRNNVIDGVWITGAGTTANVIQGNYIGTDSSGVAAAGNVDGVYDGSSSGNSILNNVISGNSGHGVTLSGSDGNVVQGNLIGMGADRVTPLGNGGNGVNIVAAADSNLIGGTAAQGNVIAYNSLAGVLVNGSVQDSIRRNNHILNGGLGIQLAAGGNNLVGIIPAISAINFSGGQHVISGTAPVASFASGSQIDVFKADPGGEGRQYLGSTVIFNDGINATWSVSVCGLAVGDQAVATATDTAGDTSQFSAASTTVGFGTCTVAPTPTITTTPAATNTPVNTNTPAGSATPTRTATPVPGAATATPTTGPMESVTLAGNTCNPVASTYPDDTAIATIAGAVSPSSNLISIWWLDAAAGRWLGYSPQFVAESDLTLVDRLEAIFICVSSASTWSRPLI